jgi:hypothetical protein
MTIRRRRRGTRRVTGAASWRRLPESSRDARLRAFDALAWMRADGLTLSAAAAAAGTTPATVRRYVGSELSRDGRLWQASRADRLYRRMAVLSDQGRVDVDVRGSRAASLIGRHFNAISRYLATGDGSMLAPFRGQRVGGVELVSDPNRIEQLAARRELDIDDIYPHT